MKFSTFPIILTSLILWYPVNAVTSISPQSDLLTFINRTESKPKLQVQIESGIVQGSEDSSYHKNCTYLKYLGIPYAAPPVGNLRWRSPVGPRPWSGILNATRERAICVQMSDDEGIEDCLYLNVYIPKNRPNGTLLSVMVWIHGGRFANGNGNYSLYGPDYLLENNVAFVSFNYRLGIFGFLSTEDLNLPGNYGLKDQVFALQWIQRNIAQFGGNPKSVTIFGDSSGGACVSYLMLIPKAKGLFHRAIMQSGSALCPWASQREPRRVVTMLAYACRIFESNTTQMVERLRKEDTRRLRNKVMAINVGNAFEPLNGLPFAPCIEPHHEDALVTSLSNEIFARGQFNVVPFIIGFTGQEASIVQDVIERTRPYIAHWDLMPQLLVPSNLNVTSKQKKKEVALKIKNYYFGKKYISMSTKTEMMNFIGDSQFVRSIRHNVQICKVFTTIFMYVFTYEGFIGRYGTTKETARKVKGAGHVEDVFYLFRKANLSTKVQSDWDVISMMTTLWTNFAKTGTPTPLWNTKVYWPSIDANSTELVYLDIDKSLSVRKNPRDDAMDFWDDLYKDYGSSTYNTYK